MSAPEQSGGYDLDFDEKELAPVTEEEVAQFMREYDAGLHPLRPEDEAALEASREKLFERIRKIMHERP